MDTDMRRYGSKGRFIKPDDLVNGPEQKVMAELGEGQYEKPVVTFTDGTKLSLNATNVDTLVLALGPNREDWIGKKIEVYRGTLRYNGNDNPAVLVRVLEVLPAAERRPLPQPVRGDLDDEIPF
jgi:hypothetical protein